MKCPIDNTELQMADRQGVEIDYCPQCRGVWLDRGELDKIIERVNTLSRSQRTGSDEEDEDERGGRRSRGRRSFGDIFDFG